MLNDDAIKQIVRAAVQEHTTPQSVRDVLVEPDVDLDGRDALKITIVVANDAIEMLTREDAALDTLVDIKNRIRDAGEDRFPVIWWSTEQELEDVGDPES
jgi:hypothetical protein